MFPPFRSLCTSASLRLGSSKPFAAERLRKESLVRLEEMLSSAIRHLFVEETTADIRANVMTATGSDLRMLASRNMLVFPDYKVTLRRGQGCAGYAWEKAETGPMEDFWKPTVATQAQLTPSFLKDKWKLSDEQIQETRHILWIVSVPLFRIVNGARTFIGVLNFDGVHRPLAHHQRLVQSNFLGECVAVGERVAEVVAELQELQRTSG
jgi:hypothetical protein